MTGLPGELFQSFFVGWQVIETLLTNWGRYPKVRSSQQPVTLHSPNPRPVSPISNPQSLTFPPIHAVIQFTPIPDAPPSSLDLPEQPKPSLHTDCRTPERLGLAWRRTEPTSDHA